MSEKSLGLVLHAHIPYVLYSKVEYWLYEAVLHSYLPFLQMLQKLQLANIQINVTINFSPILLVQLSSSKFHQGFEDYLTMRRRILTTLVDSKEKGRVLEEDLLLLEELILLYRGFGNSIIAGYQYFHKLGYITIITSSVTHAYLPFLNNFSYFMDLQISLGREISEMFFLKTTGFWSPECAVFPELPAILSRHGIEYFFADRSSSLNVRDGGVDSNVFICDGVRYITRDFDSTMKIWDSQTGYPGSSFYRDFYSDLSCESLHVEGILRDQNLLVSGVSLYSVTDLSGNFQKKVYNHEQARDQVQKHAKEFYDYLLKSNNKCTPIFFDMELFGHWWKEGVDFLYLFFLELNSCDHIHTISDFEMPNISSIPQLSTWGKNNNAESWINEKTAYLWEKLVDECHIINHKFTSQKDLSIEKIYFLLLAQASDWFFLITNNSFTELSVNMILDNLTNKRIDIKDQNLLYSILKKRLIQ